MDKVERLEAELRAAKLERAEARQAERDAVVVEWTYGVRPTERAHHKSYDESCVYYDLFGTVVNKTEAEAAGHNINDGSMAYLFNTLSGKIVGDTGGGTVYIGFQRDWDDAHMAAINALGEFLDEHPEGGDVTEIVETYKAAK